MKIKLVNNSLVTVGGKLPKAVFSVRAVDAKTPVDMFWRKRLKDADGIALASTTLSLPKQKAKPTGSNKAGNKDGVNSDE